MELFKLLFMFINFLGRKLCKFSVFLVSNIMIGPTSGVILNSNILRENIPLIDQSSPALCQHMFQKIMLCLSSRDEGRYVAIKFRPDTSSYLSEFLVPMTWPKSGN